MLIICITLLLVIISNRQLELSGYCKPQGNNNSPRVCILLCPGAGCKVRIGWASVLVYASASVAHTVNITDSRVMFCRGRLPSPLYIFWSAVVRLRLRLVTFTSSKHEAVVSAQLQPGCKDQFMTPAPALEEYKQ